jgi:hypothetical protein
VLSGQSRLQAGSKIAIRDAPPSSAIQAKSGS